MPTSASLTTLKPLTLWITRNSGKFLERNTRPLTCLLKNLYAGQEATVRTGHGTIDWFKIGKGKTNKQIGKGICQGCILSPCFFITYVQSISCEMPGWMNHKLKSRFLGKIPTNSDNRYHSKGRKRRGTKESLGEGERGE